VLSRFLAQCVCGHPGVHLYRSHGSFSTVIGAESVLFSRRGRWLPSPHRHLARYIFIDKEFIYLITATVAVATSTSYSPRSVTRCIRSLLDSLGPAIYGRIRRGDRVFVKINLGCSGAREPEQRLTTHPVLIESLITFLIDCGASVVFGDDVARAGKHVEQIYQKTGMRAVASRTGAQLVDFVSAGAREVRGRLMLPRRYLVTNVYFEADRIINLANCRSHVGITLSGAMKNMFGCVVGLRKAMIHNMFPGQPQRFARAVADVYGVVRPDLSFLDMTTIVEAAGVDPAIRSRGLMLAGTDGVALDTVAAHLIGYDHLPLWVAHYGNKLGLGCNNIENIQITHIDGQGLMPVHLRPPSIYDAAAHIPIWDRLSALANNTILKPRPVINQANCTACGDCIDRCPTRCIHPTSGKVRIELGGCSDCGCCIKLCQEDAVHFQFTGMARVLRQIANRLPADVKAPARHPLDPAWDGPPIRPE
jgi:uncharacterized protein (DUF362 family)/Pyruvate/2-oxoacid:ferredoxin oxidoreductase delta subunit